MIEEKLRKLTSNVKLVREVRDEIKSLLQESMEDVEELRLSFQQHVAALNEHNKCLLKENMQMEGRIECLELYGGKESSLRRFYESEGNYCVKF